MRAPTEREWKEALDLIRALYNRLSVADPHSQLVNRDLIQRSIDLLAKHGADGPTFE